MVRTADGKTIVQVYLTGLHPHVAYEAHVHNLPCSVNSGGGHYQHIVGGPVDAVNEIWPGFTTNAAGNGNGHAVNDFTARPEAQSVVIHDPDAANARIACADLQ
jgi:Cu-Zn family superoxide dismutase